MPHILGISAYYHDSAAALVSGGKIVAAAQEERFTRKKHDAAFPEQAIRYCLQETGLKLQDLHSVVFYEKPFVKFERLLETYLENAPRGLGSFLKAIPVWMKEKLYLKSLLQKGLGKISGLKISSLPPLLFTAHHQSHAASAFYPSPFEEAAVLCMDGVGEWATTTVWRGQGNRLTPQWEIRFPHSLGLLYSAFTYYTGFKVNSGEYKLMGLAPYGEPRYVRDILENLIDLKEDGTFRLNMKYFDYAAGLKMTNGHFERLFGGPPRKPEDPVTQKEMDLAASIQWVTEEAVLRLARTVHGELKTDNLCLAGGVALNCVANGRLLREGPFKDLWIQPASGDAGGALGAALCVWHEYLGSPRPVNGGDAMAGSYLGPQCAGETLRKTLNRLGAVYQSLGEAELLSRVAGLLDQGKVVGWVQGRMEFGPRALGSRSILGDPRNSEMQSVMNLKIKFRESFRPFAPAILSEKISDYFDLDRASPYMLLTAPVSRQRREPVSSEEKDLFGIEKLKRKRSQIPAVTHVDYSARVQTVHRETHPRFHALIQRFEALTGCPLLVNTSFNVRGEPIVCTPEDAYRCFLRTEMDYLVIEDCLMKNQEQPEENRKRARMETFELD